MKLTYINEKGLSLDISYSPPYFLQALSGEDGLKNNISTNRAHNQDGETVINENLGSRHIDITGVLQGDTKKEILGRKDFLYRLFNPKLDGQLIYSEEDTVKIIKCKVEEAPKFSNRNVWRNKNFIVSLFCPDPYWLDEYETGKQIITWIGGWKFKFKLPFRFKQKGETKVNIFNSGHVETPIEVIFKGPAVNPCIINHTTGEFIKINRELTSDDTLIITTSYGNKKVVMEKNGIRTNASKYIDLDSTFFSLEVGDNLIEYTTESLEPQSVEIRYRNRYLGV